MHVLDPIFSLPSLYSSSILVGNWGVHDITCIMGNQGKMAGNSKVCMKYFRLPPFKKRVIRLQRCYNEILDTVAVIWHFACKHVFPIYCLYFLYSQFIENNYVRFCKKNIEILKTSMQSRFWVSHFWLIKKIFLKQKWQLYYFRKNQLASYFHKNLWISCHLILITHDAT